MMEMESGEAKIDLFHKPGGLEDNGARFVVISDMLVKHSIYQSERITFDIDYILIDEAYVTKDLYTY